MSAKTITSIADLRALARRRIPRALFEFVDRGAYDEITLERNRRDFEALKFRQRVAIDVSQQSLETTLVGQPVSMPLAIAPTGLTGFCYKDGEIVGAQAAQACGIPFILSTMSICSLEDVSSAVPGPVWFQVYLLRDRGFNKELIARAQAAGCPALVLTLDVPVQGLRRQDVKTGMTIPPRLTWRNVLDVATKPGWASGVLMGKHHTFGNLANRVSGTEGLLTLAQWLTAQFDSSVGWKDVEWVRSLWPGKLILKGILDPQDALAACAIGVDAIVVSNHGGRQLDGAPSAISALPEISNAVQGRCELLLDSGIRSGQDVLRALALGARGCLIGRAYLYGLSALGGPGVRKALEVVRNELSVSLALVGKTNVTDIDSSILR